MERERHTMDLRLEKLKEEDSVFDEVAALYEASFPANESYPFSVINGGFKGQCRVYAVYDGDLLVGMISVLSHKDITHIMYLAVEPELRNRGYGSAILKILREELPGQRIIADVETPKADAENNVQREKRVEFYRKNGYVFTEIAYRWEDEDYRIMSNGGSVTGKEFGAFWHYFFH